MERVVDGLDQQHAKRTDAHGKQRVQVECDFDIDAAGLVPHRYRSREQESETGDDAVVCRGSNEEKDQEKRPDHPQEVGYRGRHEQSNAQDDVDSRAYERQDGEQGVPGSSVQVLTRDYEREVASQRTSRQVCCHDDQHGERGSCDHAQYKRGPPRIGCQFSF